MELYLLQRSGWEKIADFDVTLDDLPASDRALLSRGIALRDAEELQRTLEDFLPVS